MLFDWGWSELMLIGVVALVVIGPKELPKAMRVAGYWMKKARDLSREFQNSVEDMMRESELEEMRQGLKKATELDLEHEIGKTFDPDGSLADSLKSPELPDYSPTPHENLEEQVPEYSLESAATPAAEAPPAPDRRRGVPGFRVRGSAHRHGAGEAEPVAAAPSADDASPAKP
ncbi:MAG TPA: Sec-independent protein translocase protein TatB [Stellaceae bacterium]|nr:Sec-independent protein translocase protein TatB [Stellaceae bacterium]